MLTGNLSTQVKEHLVALNPIVIKSHDLIDARFPDLTLKEKQLFLLAISLIRPDASVDKPIKVRFPRHYLEMIFGRSNYTSKDLLAIAEGLVNRSIHIKGAKEGDWEVVNIMASARYNEGEFGMTFNLALNEHFLSLRPITTYQLARVADLSSFYQIRLYELILKEIDKGEVVFSVNVFRQLAGLDGRYAEYRAMKRCVLLPSVRAVSEHTDIVVTFDEIRTGRSVEAIRFQMQRKSAVPQQDESLSDEHKAMRAELESIHFSPELIDIVLKGYQGDLEKLRESITAGRTYIEHGEASGEYREPIAVYRSAIRHGWTARKGGGGSRARKKPPAPDTPMHASQRTLDDVLNDRVEPNHDAVRQKTIDAMLERLLENGDLYGRFVELAKRRGVFGHIDRMGLRQAAYVEPVRNVIWDFARQEIGASAD